MQSHLMAAIGSFFMIFCLVPSTFGEQGSQIADRESKCGRKINATFLASRKSVYRQREERREKYCQELKGTSIGSVDKKFKKDFQLRTYWHYGYHMSICTLPKVMSTTWVNYLIQLANVPEEVRNMWKSSYDVRLGLGKILNLRMETEELNQLVFEDSFGFLFVRHPFVRLVSAYQNKVVNQNYGGWREIIAVQNATGSFQGDPNAPIPSFQGFAKALLAGLLMNYNNERPNDHIDFFWSLCDVCNPGYKYDMIGKMETVEEDLKYLYDKLGIEEEIDSVDNSSTGKASTEDLALKHFSDVDKTVIQELYEMYKADFLLFGYDYQQYLDLGRS